MNSICYFSPVCFIYFFSFIFNFFRKLCNFLSFENVLWSNFCVLKFKKKWEDFNKIVSDWSRVEDWGGERLEKRGINLEKKCMCICVVTFLLFCRKLKSKTSETIWILVIYVFFFFFLVLRHDSISNIGKLILFSLLIYSTVV